MEDKEQFIKEFGEFLHKWGIEYIEHLEYIKDEEECTEIVKVHIDDGITGEQIIVVNVHMDNYIAMMRDILHQLQ